MNWFSRKEHDPDTPPSKNSSNAGAPESSGKKPRRRLLGGGKKNKTASPKDISHSGSQYHETSGEVLLCSETLPRKLQPQFSSVLSTRSLLATARKTRKLQFTVDIDKNRDASIASSTLQIQQIVRADAGQPDKEPPLHRVPLTDAQPTASSSQDALFLLRSYEPLTEQAAMEHEIMLLEEEIDALQEDRNQLVASLTNFTANRSQPTSEMVGLTSKTLTAVQREALAEQRGSTLTVAFSNESTFSVFLSKCGLKSNTALISMPCTIAPTQCRQGGAAATMAHVKIMHSHATDASTASFLICRDYSKAFHHSHLPERFFRRIKNSGLNPRSHAGNLAYLATGPLGCYYATFRSGECWWGSGVEDDDFQSVCRDWKVHRVSFGNATVLDDENARHYISSWIVVSKDGRVAYKNIPSRLARLLENRLTSDAALVEVALGGDNTYFVRFLDGTTDYVLPRHIAEACVELEAMGAKITSVSFHCRLPGDDVIRSTAPQTSSDP